MTEGGMREDATTAPEELRIAAGNAAQVAEWIIPACNQVTRERADVVVHREVDRAVAVTCTTADRREVEESDESEYIYFTI